jgi:endo-1,4-beta-xylanase
MRFLPAVFLLGMAGSAQTLRDLADQRGIRIGAAVDPSRFVETAYTDTLGREFNQVEPENAMKFQPIHPSASTYNFRDADSIAAFAKSHNQSLRGHTLVWHQQNPTWVISGNTAAQLAGILQDHIKTVVSRYAGRVYAWDVVNEAFNDNGTLRSTIWYDAPGIGFTGTEYIEQAFRWARAADANTLLFYNDYSAESVNAKSDAIYAMVKDFRGRGVPIDGVGLQMHFTAGDTSLGGVESNIRRLTDLGLQVQITELDVRLAVDSSGNASPALLSTQAQIYRDVVAICLKFPLCTAIQTWGFTDRYSWIPGTFAGQGAGLPFDASYRAKPAYDSMLASLKTAPPVISAGTLANAASYAADAVSPGQIFVLFGPTFGPASIQVGASPGVRVLFDGVAAPLIYSRVGQVSAVAPFGIAGKNTTQLQYEYLGMRSNTVSIPVQPSTPGVFTVDSSGKGAAAVLDSAYRVISKENPARRGDVLQLFATGGGVTTPAIGDGGTAGASPLALNVTAALGGIDCPVAYAGSAPGLIAGAVQINFQVPAGLGPGDQPLVVNVGGLTSQGGVTVTVQ